MPFCRVVCPYCDFAVRTGGPRLRERWTSSLLDEAALRAADAPPFDTLYLGGGTPSWLDLELLERLVAGLADRLDTSRCHLSLEANPEDVTVSSLAAWRALGVRSLSLGVQALDVEALALLKRRHTATQARKSCELALDAGFDSVSIDLIYGLPGHTLAAWRRTLDEAVALGPQHLSCYELTIHEGTLFGRLRRRGELMELEDVDRAELFLLTHRRLGEAGYEGYEVSNFARELRHRSRHNLKYWNHTCYLGLGPSAHSFDGRRRWWNHRRLGDWQASVEAGEPPTVGSELLDHTALALETVMLGLRSADGIDLAAFERRFGADLLALNSTLVERLVDDGLVHVTAGRLAPTLAGFAVADGLAGQLSIGPEGL